MLFNFQKFVQDLRDNPEKKEVVEKFEKFYGEIKGGITDQHWYKEYVTQFPTVEYLVPEELEPDFDWKLLMELVWASFSSDGLIQVVEEKDKPEFVISVQSGDQVVVKKVSELRGFQMLRLYEIYAEEQMNLEVLIAEDEKEKAAIMAQRESRQHRWKLVLDNMDKDNAVGADKEEKESKLDDLMSQL